MRDNSKKLALAVFFLVSAGALSFGGGGKQEPSSPGRTSAPGGNGLRLVDRPVSLRCVFSSRSLWFQLLVPRL
jgi:hypothetical protein